MSSAPLSYKELARYYDLIYTFKDYQKEAEKVQTIIEKFKKSEGHELLDVACGTAKHLLFLQDSYQCTGVDMSDEMLEIAKRKLPHLEFREENMIHMRLEKQFDIITCLFSSIGYVKIWKNLQKTWETFAFHLKKGGVAVVEPWFIREQYKIGLPCMTTYEDENIKIARLNVANA
jgi:ubiquinone/menaquinone biosynthesis C-methylase UbiE